MADRPLLVSSPTPKRMGVSVGVWNEMSDSAGGLRPHWQHLGEKIGHWNADERSATAVEAGRMIEDLGTTFNVFSDVGGAGRPYELDPIPLVIPPAEWAQVSDGLCQRMRLLDAVLADLYGPQTLLEKGLVPPDLVHSNPSFLPFASGVQPQGGRHLVATACDLVRTESGDWSVMCDHAGIPSGLGQVFENRNVTSNLLAESFGAMGVARISGFMQAERATIESLSFRRRDRSSIVFLTPGFRHPSYFEHAYKARLLGYPLVEPADLTVRERRLFLKTLDGLRKVDVVICRMEHVQLDPLEHWEQVGDGVPGMVEAWRTGNVAIINAPGTAFASSPALMPFLPKICSEWFGEPLKLPFVETWWLGQADVRRRVLEQLERFILLPASPSGDRLLPIQGSGLSPSARKQWVATIHERPHEFVVQAAAAASEMPSLEGRMIRQRPVIWRAYTLNGADGCMALSGGLARIGENQRPAQMWPVQAGVTKDVWISDSHESAPSAERKVSVRNDHRQMTAPEVPSRIAEQLFWVGRYAERIELTTRLLRATLRCLSGETGRLQHEQLSACLRLCMGCELIPEGEMISPAHVLTTLSALTHDASAGGGITALTRYLRVNAAAARDRLSDDTWRLFNRLESIVNPADDSPAAADLLRTLDALVLHFAAFAGMQAENMTRGHGWRFLEIGRRIERALGGLSLLRTATAMGEGETPVLDPLLETCDSVMTYRRRHFSRPRLDAVTDLILFDAGNPRSVAYQINVIHAEVQNFPGRMDSGLMPKICENIDLLVQQLISPDVPDVAEYGVLNDSLEGLSDLLTQHFFSHSVRRVY